MFGCLRRLGCLVILLIVAAALWLTRPRWQAKLFGERTPAATSWTPIADSAAQRTGQGAVEKLQSLEQPGGPAFIDLTASQLGELLVEQAGSRLPSSLEDAQIAIVNDRVLLRGTIQLDDIKGIGALGPLGDFTKGRQRIEVGGTLDVVRPGLGEFRVESAQLGDLRLPQAAVPRVMQMVWKGARPEGVAASALPIPLPKYIGDVRVARGHVTLYRATP